MPGAPWHQAVENCCEIRLLPPPLRRKSGQFAWAALYHRRSYANAAKPVSLNVFVANRRPELQQGDARASGAMRVASQRAPARFVTPAPTQTPSPVSLARGNQSLSEPDRPLQQRVVAKVTPEPEQAKDRAGMAGQQVPFRLPFFLFDDPGRAATGSPLHRPTPTLRARLPPAPPPSRRQEPLCRARVDLSLAGR